MAFPKVLDAVQLAQEGIRRTVAATPSLTWFGEGGVARSLLDVSAQLGSYTGQLYTSVLRRFTLQAADGEQLDQVLVESGTPRRGAQRAKALICLQPYTATLQAITSGATDLLEVPAGAGVNFAVADSIRVRNSDGTETETATVIAVTSGTGPSSGDEIEVATLAGTYTPGSDDCAVILRRTLAIGQQVTGGNQTFELLAAVSLGDANPVLAGESVALALADKAWAECTTAGAVGNVAAGTLTTLSPPVAGVTAVNNPNAATGGADTETDFAAKRRAANATQGAAQETVAWVEAVAQVGDEEVLRASRTTSIAVGEMQIGVVGRGGGALSTARLEALEGYIAARVRSHLGVDVVNVTMTAVEVKATITLRPSYTLRVVFADAASRITEFLDIRKREFGEDVDEADLLVLVRQTPGVGSLETATFEPAANVEVAADSLPTLTRLWLIDATSGDEINATLTQTY
jgi:uncharacterized phage protein gp47/JayE